jgi:hypothetical protein
MNWWFRIRFSETSVYFQRTTRRYIPGDTIQEIPCFLRILMPCYHGMVNRKLNENSTPYYQAVGHVRAWRKISTHLRPWHKVEASSNFHFQSQGKDPLSVSYEGTCTQETVSAWYWWEKSCFCRERNPGLPYIIRARCSVRITTTTKVIQTKMTFLRKNTNRTLFYFPQAWGLFCVVTREKHG